MTLEELLQYNLWIGGFDITGSITLILIVLLLLVIFIGAIFGGKSFGSVIIRGLIGLITISLIATAIVYYLAEENDRKQKIQKNIQQIKNQEILENLSIEKKNDLEPNNFIRFENKCNKKIDLNIRYFSTKGLWENEGVYTFDVNEKSYLSSEGQRLRSNNSILFYNIEKTDGEFLDFRGKFKFIFDGNEVMMKKVRDDSGTTDFSYSCN